MFEVFFVFLFCCVVVDLWCVNWLLLCWWLVGFMLIELMIVFVIVGVVVVYVIFVYQDYFVWLCVGEGLVFVLLVWFVVVDNVVSGMSFDGGYSLFVVICNVELVVIDGVIGQIMVVFIICVVVVGMNMLVFVLFVFDKVDMFIVCVLFKKGMI